MLGFVSLASAPIADDASSYVTFPNITTGAPVVDNLTAQISYSFAPSAITTSAPTVGSLSAQIEILFTINDIATGAPTLTGRWLWVVQPGDTQDWTDASAASNTWSDVPEVSNVWSDAA
jgi:hypothetical protein